MATITDPIDLLLDADGDLVVGTDLSLSSGVAAVTQGIRVRLLTFRGEWFLDLDSGVPYYQEILGKKFDQQRAHAAFREAILATPGVNELLSLVVTFDSPTRELRVLWKANTVFGVAEDTVALET